MVRFIVNTFIHKQIVLMQVGWWLGNFLTDVKHCRCSSIVVTLGVVILAHIWYSCVVSVWVYIFVSLTVQHCVSTSGHRKLFFQPVMTEVGTENSSEIAG